MTKAHSVINSLKFSSDEALRAFKTRAKFQMIHYVHKIVDKDNALQKVKVKIEYLKKDIKDAYSLFKPLIEKGLPHFWDENNCLLRKEDYDNLLVQRRNDHS